MSRETRFAPFDFEHVETATAGGLLVALFALPLAGPAFDALGVTPPPVADIVIPWLFAGAVVGIVVSFEDRPVSSLGVRRPDVWDIPYAIAAFVGALLALVATDSVVSALGLAQTEGSTLADGRTIGIALAGAISAGVVEEILYRGYPIERLLEATDSALAAGAISWLAFTLAHAPGYPAGHVVQVSLGALVFTLVYLRRRTLVAVVLAHVAVNVAGVLSAVYA
ncbi:CPBP family intramembrane glutamic endopeptidase [Halorussus amylolyticus]|uniref:CPBP family intramembrane glutamic endopeptidase n=1 Tax=Halorussus amylolyticus TaxID=1126242 RepID=UPI0010493F75|nr:CPBP family intramembrane glutamic endopeptidase [Halorussus amylolyticus]